MTLWQFELQHFMDLHCLLRISVTVSSSWIGKRLWVVWFVRCLVRLLVHGLRFTHRSRHLALALEQFLARLNQCVALVDFIHGVELVPARG